MRSLILILLPAATVALLTGCQPSDPPLTTPPQSFTPKVGAKVYQGNFKFERGGGTDRQEKFDKNEVTATFTAKDSHGESVKNLLPTDLLVQENGIKVWPFSLEKSIDNRFYDTVEIALVLDVTGTMARFIHTMTSTLQNFIEKSRKAGYHTRICFSTFGDYTVKPCGKFYDNNPNDPSTKSQMHDLISQLNEVKAGVGPKDDKGWPDLAENSMRGLIDATQAKWTPGAQKFVILVTDWGFLYKANRPGDEDNSGNTPPGGDASPERFEKNNVPKFSQVIGAIKSSGVKVFAVTRTEHVYSPKDGAENTWDLFHGQPIKYGQLLKWDGYNTPFQGEPSIVEASGGAYFNFDEIIANPSKLDNVFNTVIEHLNITWKLTYVADQVPGLNPAISNDKRRLEITSTKAKIGDLKYSSSIPKGHAEPRTVFKGADSAIQVGSEEVLVDGVKQSTSAYSVKGGDIVFRAPPAPGAKIDVSYYYEAAEKNFRTKPIVLAGSAKPENTTVKLNGVIARPEHISFGKDLSGFTTLSLSPSAYGPTDPYHILGGNLHVYAETK